MAINFFNHPSIGLINEQIKLLTQTLRPGDTIKAIHTPIVLPLGTSTETGGYARSLGFAFGPKRIAINCDRLLQESPSMQEFILGRQVALFDKSCRCLHLPVAGIAVAIAFLASSVLFPSSILALVTIPSIIALASAVIIAKKERENELYADLKAFRNCKSNNKQDVLFELFNNAYEPRKIEGHEEISLEPLYRPRTVRSPIAQDFSGYPTALERHKQLIMDWREKEDSTTP